LPRLLLVPPHVTPPEDCDQLEDWARTTADEREIELRCATIAVRTDVPAALMIDAEPPVAEIARRLLGALRVPVRRATLQATYIEAGGSTSTRAFESALASARRRLAARGVRVTTLSGGCLHAEVTR